MTLYSTTYKCKYHQCLNCGYFVKPEDELKLLRKWLRGKAVTKDKVRSYINNRLKELNII